MSESYLAELPAILSTAEAAARAGGEVLLRYRADDAALGAKSKGTPRDLVTLADAEVERLVVGALLEAFPDHAVLAEEGAITPRAARSHSGDWLWIVDPIDGTTNFVHHVPFYCVAVGLSYKDRPVLGVVHAPELNWTFTAYEGGGAFRNGEAIRVSSTEELSDSMLATGFSYRRNEPGHDDNMARIQAVLPLCRGLRRCGSAQLDLAMTACGSFDAYWEKYLAPYDLAAGAVIVREAGGRVTDLAGGDDWLYGGEVLASNSVIHETVRARVGD